MASEIYLGLDVGSARIGVAMARSDVRISSPLTTLQYSEQSWEDIQLLVAQNNISALVVGWPRDMRGNETEQTRFAEEFAEKLREHVDIPVYLQDEALTSQKAEAELNRRKKPYNKADIDALAATYILEDYLLSHVEQPHV